MAVKIGARTWRDSAEIRSRSQVTPGIRDYVSSVVSGKEMPLLSYEEARKIPFSLIRAATISTLSPPLGWKVLKLA